MPGYMDGRQTHIDQHLTNVALGYAPAGFVAPRIAPIIPVGKQHDLLPEWVQDDWFRRPSTNRAPNTQARMVEFRVNSQRYYANNYALKIGLTVEDRVNADPVFQMQSDESRTRFLRTLLDLDYEVRVLSQVGSTSNVGSSSVVASSWTTRTSNSNPVGDIWAQMDAFQDANGYRPNKLLFGNRAWRDVSRHNTVIDKIRQTALAGAGLSVREQDVATLFEVDDVLVARGYQNTAQEGIAAAYSAIFNDKVLLYYAPPTPSMELPSFMYSFRWSAPGIANMTVERHPFDQKTKSEEIEMGYYQDELVTAARFGWLITGTGSSQ